MSHTQRGSGNSGHLTRPGPIAKDFRPHDLANHALADVNAFAHVESLHSSSINRQVDRAGDCAGPPAR